MIHYYFVLFFADPIISIIFAGAFWIPWAISSVGSEHLPYKQRVGGSTPSSPTTHQINLFGEFLKIFTISGFIFSFISDRTQKSLDKKIL
jgi:hypothetical protein